MTPTHFKGIVSPSLISVDAALTRVGVSRLIRPNYRLRSAPTFMGLAAAIHYHPFPRTRQHPVEPLKSLVDHLIWGMIRCLDSMEPGSDLVVSGWVYQQLCLLPGLI